MSAADGNASRLAEHERLVAALMRDPAAFDVPPAERSLITTAISTWVALTGALVVRNWQNLLTMASVAGSGGVG